MRVLELSLRNYRIFEEVDLELPARVIGIFGVNGAGKSTLMESIAFACYGVDAARTRKQEIRTHGVLTDCEVRLVFEHAGQPYEVRRTIGGKGHTPGAELFGGGMTLATGTTEVDAEIVGTDPSTDVAVLDVDRPESDMTVLQFAPTGALEVGNPVIVLGSPFGLEGTLTTGVISAVGREIRSPNGFTIENAVQTDAALNHGNSGGPVLDTQGRVVGIAAQIRSDSGGSDGVGYAVPGDTAKRVAAALIADGKIEHAYLGVSLADDGAAKLESVVPNSPASRGGLRTGDVVIEVDGESIETGDELRNEIDARKPGDELELKVRRGSQERDVTVELGTRPATAQ